MWADLIFILFRPIAARACSGRALTYNFQGTHRPILGASRGHLCDSAWLLVLDGFAVHHRKFAIT